MKIMNLAMANIRKSKSASVSLFIFILIAALLLNIGLMVITQVSPFYDEKVEQLNDPHVTIVADQESFDSKYEDFFRNDSRVTATEVEEIVNLDIAKFTFDHNELTYSVIIFNADENRNLGPLKLIEKINTPQSNDIFVPYSFKTNGGYKLGDHFSITYQDKEYEYRIAGFFETAMMGTNNLGVMKFMLPDSSYQTLADELDGISDGVIISSLLKDPTKASAIKVDFLQEIEKSIDWSSTYLWGLDIELVKYVNTLTVNILAMILVAFATMIILVSLIVIRFRVSNSIEEGMVNIGVLKAVGYSSRQILFSIILQFILIALCASLVGIALSYIVMPFLGSIISTLTGLIWIQKFDVIINLISIFLVILSIVIVTLLSALRIRKILPIAALRGGIQTHSFRKNYFPLEKTRSGLQFLLGMKTMIVNAKQNVMILIIMSSLTFASVFSVVLYYNISVDKTAFVNLFGSEPANVMIAVQSDVNTNEFLHDIEQMDHVQKVNIYDKISTKIDGHFVDSNVTEDYSLLENNIVFEGRQPKFDNEIAISWVLANQINKGIGDTVEVQYGTESAHYLVTGLGQSINNLGLISLLTMDGIKQLQSDYQGSTLYVYLDGISNKNFIKELQAEYGERIFETLDIDETTESQLGMYTAASFSVMVLVLVITLLVVMVILYLVIKTIIIKRKQEFGIMKAIGYTTIQLMNQISISFLPVIITGVVMGGLLGYFFINPMLSILLSGAGAKHMQFLIQPQIVLSICLAIFILAYLVSMFVSQRIRKISAYGLITE